MGDSIPTRDTARYMKTRISTLAIGFRMEKTTNTNGSVQLDSTCQPSHAAGTKLRRRYWIIAFLPPSIRQGTFAHCYSFHSVQPVVCAGDESDRHSSKQLNF